MIDEIFLGISVQKQELLESKMHKYLNYNDAKLLQQHIFNFGDERVSFFSYRLGKGMIECEFRRPKTIESNTNNSLCINRCVLTYTQSQEELYSTIKEEINSFPQFIKNSDKVL